MSRHYYDTNKKCETCGQPIMGFEVKSPFIDDYDEGCVNDECDNYRDPVHLLNSRERSAARRDCE